MSLRGEFCRVLDKYKSGKWDRDRSAAALEKYFNAHQTAEIIAELERLKKIDCFNEAYTTDPRPARYIDIRLKELKSKAKETQL